MDWNLFWLFVVLNIANVVIQTVRSIATIKCGKVVASLTNAVAYGLYTVVVVYTVCDLDLWLKVAVVAVANLVGVYVVKELEERARKDKLWKVEATVNGIEPYDELNEHDISCNCFYTTIRNEYIINCFCKTQEESAVVKKILDKHHAKYFVSENKGL